MTRTLSYSHNFEHHSLHPPQVLDTWTMTRHLPQLHPYLIGDCTHFCLPGVPDVWNQFLQHTLRCRACANGGKCRPAYVQDC